MGNGVELWKGGARGGRLGMGMERETAAFRRFSRQIHPLQVLEPSGPCSPLGFGP